MLDNCVIAHSYHLEGLCITNLSGHRDAAHAWSLHAPAPILKSFMYSGFALRPGLFEDHAPNLRLLVISYSPMPSATLPALRNVSRLTFDANVVGNGENVRQCIRELWSLSLLRISQLNMVRAVSSRQGWSSGDKRVLLPRWRPQSMKRGCVRLRAGCTLKREGNSRSEKPTSRCGSKLADASVPSLATSSVLRSSGKIIQSVSDVAVSMLRSVSRRREFCSLHACYTAASPRLYTFSSTASANPASAARRSLGTMQPRDGNVWMSVGWRLGARALALRGKVRSRKNIRYASHAFHAVKRFLELRDKGSCRSTYAGAER